MFHHACWGGTFRFGLFVQLFFNSAACIAVMRVWVICTSVLQFGSMHQCDACFHLSCMWPHVLHGAPLRRHGDQFCAFSMCLSFFIISHMDSYSIIGFFARELHFYINWWNGWTLTSDLYGFVVILKAIKYECNNYII